MALYIAKVDFPDCLSQHTTALCGGANDYGS